MRRDLGAREAASVKSHAGARRAARGARAVAVPGAFLAAVARSARVAPAVEVGLRAVHDAIAAVGVQERAREAAFLDNARVRRLRERAEPLASVRLAARP